MIRDILELDSRRPSSININFDKNDNDKVNSYIVTSKSIEIISEMIRTFETKEKKSKVLVGPYGKGKSHLMLYFLDLISKSKRNVSEYKTLIDKVDSIESKEYDNIKTFIKSEAKYMPVILDVTMYNNNIVDIFIYGLKNALETNGINDISLDTYFDKAIDKIELWENDYPETSKKLEGLMNKSTDDIKLDLKNYNKDRYLEFEEAYKVIQSGEKFNPLEGADPIKVYKEVAKELKNRGYKGIYIVYDEFSKYIEYLIEERRVLDIKILQDFAEFCNRDNEYEVYLTLISHKNISQYTDNLENKDIDKWKAIEGRFEYIYYNGFSNQQYEIISSSIIKKDKEWNDILNKEKVYFKELENDSYVMNMFKGLNETNYKNWILYGSYPLHPITTYLLPRISEKVSQNERTMFNFIKDRGENTLEDFLNKYNTFVTPDVIFDYFEEDIKSFSFEDDIYKIFIRAISNIEKTDIDYEKRIIKTIAIINISNNYNEIRPDMRALLTIYGSECKRYIDDLINKKILINEITNDTLSIATDFEISINKEISNEMANHDNEPIEKIFNEIFKDVYVESRRHNDDNNIVRYFRVMMTSENNFENNVLDKLENDGANGIIFLFKGDFNYKFAVHDLAPIINKVYLSEKEEKVIRMLWSINKLKEKNKKDKTMFTELETIENKIKTSCNEIIDNIVSLQNSNEILYKSNIIKLSSKKELSDFLSDIMDDIYKSTININNEIINKNKVTKVAINARKKINKAILDDEYIELRKGSLESTIFRSIYLKNYVADEINDGIYKLNLYNHDKNNKFIKVINLLEDFIKSGENKSTSIKNIVDILTMPKYGIGLKKSIIPFILTFLIAKNKKAVSIILNEEEIYINEEEIEKLIENKESYIIRIDKIDDQEEKYIEELKYIFNDYIEENEKRENISYIVLAMKKWFLCLDKYTRNCKDKYIGAYKTEKVSKESIILRRKLRHVNENSVKFIFEDIKKIFKSKNNDEILEKIKTTKQEIEVIKEDVYSSLEEDIKSIFGIRKGNSINRSICDYLEKNNVEKANDKKLKSFNDFAYNNKSNNNIEDYIDRISNLLVGIYLSDGDDETPLKLISEISKLKDEIESMDIEELDNNKEESINDIEVREIKGKAKMLLNDIKDTFEEYESVLDEAEIKNVLVKLLKDME